MKGKQMMKMLLISAVIITSLTGCETYTTSKSKTDVRPKEIEERPELADFPLAKWEGRNIYEFFYEVFEEGTPVSTFTNEVFSTAPHKGVSWEIIQASRGMNVVGVHVPTPAHLKYSLDRDDWIRKWKAKIPFPVDETTFVINRWSDVEYLDGQKFKQHVIFTGYEEGFLQYFGDTTNEINKLCFLTADGLADAFSYFESLEE